METLAIIVNYKSWNLTRSAVQSVLQSASLGPARVVVVDNSEDEEEAAALRSGLPHGVELLVSEQNVGFGRACNRAYERFPAEHLLLLNPDARLLPGCLARLQQTLASSPGLAAVSPQVFWDDGCRFSLPPSYPIWLLFFGPVLADWGATAVMALLSVLWRHYSIKVWRSARPLEVKNLSGGHVLLNGDAVRSVGGLFDPRFFLYFEDTDLFLRLRRAGYRLVLEPRATAIHHYDQCGRQHWQEKREHMANSHRLFLRKHWTGWNAWVARLGGAKSATQPKPARSDERAFTSPFVVEVPERLRGGWLFEWSPNQDLIPAVGRFGRGRVLDFPAECWAMLAPGTYFGRLGSPSGFGMKTKRFSWKIRTQDCPRMASS